MALSPEHFDVVINRLMTLQLPTVTCPQKLKLEWGIHVKQVLPVPWLPATTTSSLAEDFIWLVIFVQFFDFGGAGETLENIQVLELFSGVARVAKTATRCGYSSRAYDILYDRDHKRKFRFSTHNQRKKRSFMDLNGAAGIAFLE